MEFGLSQDQKLFDSAVSRLLGEMVSLDHVRDLAGQNVTLDQPTTGALADLGAFGICVPDSFGGSGLTLFDAILVMDALGAAAAAVPYLGAAILAPTALVGAGSDRQKQEWLPPIAAGETRIGIALSELTGSRKDSAVTHANGKLSGKALFVIDGVTANLFVVAAGRHDLFLVPRDAKGLAVAPISTVDRTRSFAELIFTDVEAEPLGKLGGAGATIERMIAAGRIGLAADTLGAAQTMFDRAVAYAKERKQFGRAIASFQAIKHMCADMAAELVPCRSLVWYAAHAFDTAPHEAAVIACHAKAHLSEVGRQVARQAIEVHGGMGFTDLMGLHFWFKRIGLDRQLLGSPERVRQEAATLQGWIAHSDGHP